MKNLVAALFFCIINTALAQTQTYSAFCSLSTANDANSKVYLDNALKNFVNGENEACNKDYAIEKLFENDKVLNFPIEARKKYCQDPTEENCTISYFSQFKIDPKPKYKSIRGYKALVYTVDFIYTAMYVAALPDAQTVCEKNSSEVWVLKNKNRWYIATPNYINNNLIYYFKNREIGLKKINEKITSMKNSDVKSEKEISNLIKSRKRLELMKLAASQCKLKF